MTGKTYNSWLIIRPLELLGKQRLYWEAKCLECNNIFSVEGASVRAGLSKRCSGCGCKNSTARQIGKIKTKRTPKESSEHYFYLREKSRAIRYGREWTISKEETISLIYDNCKYCKRAPYTKSNLLKNMGLNQKRLEGAVITRNGIDRIDSSLGYVSGNVVTCCNQCNTMKLDYVESDFIAHCKLIAAQNP